MADIEYENFTIEELREYKDYLIGMIKEFNSRTRKIDKEIKRKIQEFNSRTRKIDKEIKRKIQDNEF